MSSILELQSSRVTRALDSKSERQSRFLPYLKSHNASPIKLKVKHRNNTNHSMQTHVRRYDKKDAITILSIRFSSAEENSLIHNQQQSYIKQKSKPVEEDSSQKSEQNQRDKLLPYIKYKKYESPQQHLRKMGYDPDARLSSEIYSERVQERKNKYINKMESLKLDLVQLNDQRRHDRMQKSRIQVKILGQQIRRKRERQLLMQQQRKGHNRLQSLISSGSAQS